MHDPMTVAFEIKSPFRSAPSKFWPKGYRNTLITIWHVDPETDGSDDSCGWFKRARHGDKAVFERIKKSFAFEWDPEYGGWFRPETGDPRLSVTAIVLCMFRAALWEHYGQNSKRTDRFIRKHLTDILLFAENPTDSMHPSITQRYGKERREDRIEGAASVVYGCILRWERNWWQHPRWHVHHWRLQVHPWQRLRRWLWGRCDGCGKRFGDGGVFQTGHRQDENTGRSVPVRKCERCAGAKVAAVGGEG